MDYIKKSDILKVINQEHLDYIIEKDTTKLDLAEATAIEELTAYIDIRYNAGTTFLIQNKKSLLAMYVVDIMLYHLHTRISTDNVPEIRIKRYEAAMEWADKVADGYINAGLPTKPTEENSTTIRFGGNKKQTHYY